MKKTNIKCPNCYNITKGKIEDSHCEICDYSIMESEFVEVNKKMRKLLKKSFFNIHTFKAWCFFSNNKDEFEELLKYHHADETDMNVSGKCIWLERNGYNKFFIGVFDGSVSTLAHEATHLALFIMNKIGQQLSYDDELVCYLVEEIVEKNKNNFKG